MAQENSRETAAARYSVPAARFFEEHGRKGTLPVILQFQPTEFEIVQDPEQLRAWERNLGERVGLVAVDGRGERVLLSGTCSESKCPDYDDCDEDGPIFTSPSPPPP